jgi:N-acylneuraminate cytidylyltransferase
MIIKKETIIAVIPVRAGSKRLPNKNILPFGSSNLLIHKIRQIKQVINIDKIIVSSDSDEMLDMAKEEGVFTHRRAIEFCDEKTKTFNEVVEHIASYISDGIMMWAPCVCPLTMPETYFNAVNIYKDIVLNKNKYDSVVSAKIFKEYLFDDNGPKNFIPENHVPSQKLPEWKVIINGFYIAKTQDMSKWRFLYGKNPYLFILDKKQAVDIDDKEDFEVAKALLNL